MAPTSLSNDGLLSRGSHGPTDLEETDFSGSSIVAASACPVKNEKRREKEA